MQATDEQVHFSYFISKVREELKSGPMAYGEGQDAFLSNLYVVCLERECNKNSINPMEVFEHVLSEVQYELSESPIAGDIKEFWLGYFDAQVIAKKIFDLAYCQFAQAV